MSNIRQRDLSIGDWVNAGGEPAKIIQLGIVGRNKAKGLSGQMYGFLTSSEIKPIPITSEILKSNGWYEDDYDTCTDYITDDTLIMYNKERKDWKACIMNGSPVVRVKVFFTYVHELQHALRLAGLDKDIKL